MQPLRAIFFDIGDTLVFDDPPLRERFRQAMRLAGLLCPEERLHEAFRVGEDYALSRYLTGLPFDDPDVLRETAARIVMALGLSPLTEPQWTAIAEAFSSVVWTRHVHPKAIPLLESLRARGFRIGAISDWEETLPELLAELALAPHLDALAVSALVGVTKPDPRLFQEALRRAQIEPAEALHVGDWYELDVCGARTAGMQGVLFDHQRRRPEADCPCFETFDALAEFLMSLPCPVH